MKSFWPLLKAIPDSAVGNPAGVRDVY